MTSLIDTAANSDALSTGVPVGAGFDLLLVEDDRGDALLVDEMLSEGGEEFRTTWVRSIAEAKAHLPGTAQCVLLDLDLPDATGLTGLRQVLLAAPKAAVVVLTGLGDRAQGAAAVAAGAQDYLVKAEVDGNNLARSIRYAVERKRAADTARLLLEADLRAEHNVRLEQGLLPRPLLSDRGLTCATGYRPGGGSALLGGDFYDAIELPDGSLRLVIGDVCGHGPDEAALGVLLRVAWRTLVLAGHSPDKVLAVLDAVLERERQGESIFVTLCDLAIEADRRTASIRLAGHPPPINIGSQVAVLHDEFSGPPLGILSGPGWPGTAVDLGPRWSILLYTDGLIEGRVPAGDRLGEDGLLRILREFAEAHTTDAMLVDGLLGRVEQLNGGPLPDDVALLLLSHDPAGS